MFKRDKREKLTSTTPVAQTYVAQEEVSRASKVTSFWKVLRRSEFAFLRALLTVPTALPRAFYDHLFDVVDSCGCYYALVAALVRREIASTCLPLAR